MQNEHTSWDQDHVTGWDPDTHDLFLASIGSRTSTETCRTLAPPAQDMRLFEPFPILPECSYSQQASVSACTFSFREVHDQRRSSNLVYFMFAFTTVETRIVLVLSVFISFQVEHGLECLNPVRSLSNNPCLFAFDLHRHNACLSDISGHMSCLAHTSDKCLACAYVCNTRVARPLTTC